MSSLCKPKLTETESERIFSWLFIKTPKDLPFDKERIYDYVKSFSFPRLSGTEGERKAVDLTVKAFKKIGFKRVEKNHLPHKIWTECLRCPYFPDACVEIAMVKDGEWKVRHVPVFTPGDLPREGNVPVEPVVPAVDGRSGRRVV